MKAIIRTAKNIALCLMAFTDLLTLLPIIGSIIAFFRKRITAAFIVHQALSMRYKSGGLLLAKLSQEPEKSVSGNGFFVISGRLVVNE